MLCVQPCQMNLCVQQNHARSEREHAALDEELTRGYINNLKVHASQQDRAQAYRRIERAKHSRVGCTLWSHLAHANPRPLTLASDRLSFARMIYAQAADWWLSDKGHHDPTLDISYKFQYHIFPALLRVTP